FSSKEIHVNSGMYYYLYRFYDPNFQRWINQDPIGEEGGINLYGFIGNDSLDGVDPLGLFGNPIPEVAYVDKGTGKCDVGRTGWADLQPNLAAVELLAEIDPTGVLSAAWGL